MCDPVTIGLIATTALSAGSQYAQGQTESSLYNANAQYATSNAEATRIAGAQEEQGYRNQVRARLGAQRAALGAAGADTASGTGLKLQADTAQIGEQDALTIRANAYRKAFGYDVEAYENRMRAKMARTKGNVGAFSTLLGGGFQAYQSGGFSFGGGSKLGASAGEAMGLNTPLPSGMLA